jgi:hypothetical protein
MLSMTTRETAHAVLDRYPDEELEGIIELLSCRRAPDGTDLSWKAILARSGGRDLTAEEFQLHFGHLPTDGEG